jgi:ribosomal protein S18 acetylase RimI-like enzyme
MTVVMSTPDVEGLSDVLRGLREWQHDEAPVQLHPGDLGWDWRFGAEAVARAVRTWRREDQILAVGFVDSPGLMRMAVAPEVQADVALAEAMLADLNEQARGLSMPRIDQVEARAGDALRRLLVDDGWTPDEAWTPLRRGLADPVEECAVRIEITTSERADVRSAVQRAAFDTSTFTEDRWRAMASGPMYADARCLVAYDDEEVPVAAATVWSAGKGRPGLLEPVGVHRDHQGRGYGTAIARAAATALREMGSSCATVCTSSSNARAVATYKSAGFDELPEVRDFRRST